MSFSRHVVIDYHGSQTTMAVMLNERGDDDVLWFYLGDELDLALPLPPRVPSFASETVRPGKSS